MPAAKIRTVVWQQEAQSVLDAAIAHDRRVEDVYDALEVRMSRLPETGYKVPSTTPQAYTLHLRQWLGGPGLQVLYTFNDNETTLISARTLDDDAALGDLDIDDDVAS